MGLEKQLRPKKAEIVNQWMELLINDYPAETARFIRDQKDGFANPIGGHIRKAFPELFDQLLQPLNPEAVARCIDPVIRIRAAQDLSASRCVGFVFGLKKIVRRALGRQAAEPSIQDALLEFDEAVDKLGLIAFNVFTGCREKINQLKLSHERDRIYSAFSRAGLIEEDSGDAGSNAS